MAPRAYWKGYLKLSLVSCPIALYPASSSSERVSFNRINKKTGSRLKQQNVDAETGEPVEREDIGRGYEVGKGQYLQVEDDELATMCLSSGFGDLLNTEVYLRAYEFSGAGSRLNPFSETAFEPCPGRHHIRPISTGRHTEPGSP